MSSLPVDDAQYLRRVFRINEDVVAMEVRMPQDSPAEEHILRDDSVSDLSEVSYHCQFFTRRRLIKTRSSDYYSRNGGFLELFNAVLLPLGLRHDPFSRGIP